MSKIEIEKYIIEDLINELNGFMVNYEDSKEASDAQQVITEALWAIEDHKGDTIYRLCTEDYMHVLNDMDIAEDARTKIKDDYTASRVYGDLEIDWTAEIEAYIENKYSDILD